MDSPEIHKKKFAHYVLFDNEPENLECILPDTQKIQLKSAFSTISLKGLHNANKSLECFIARHLDNI